MTFIYTPTAHYSMNEHGAPLGAPERDVSNFEQRLAHYGHEHGLSPGDVSQLQEHFRSSYRDAGGSPLSEASMRVFGARSVLNKLLQIADQLAEVDKLNAEESGGRRHSLTSVRSIPPCWSSRWLWTRGISPRASRYRRARAHGAGTCSTSGRGRCAPCRTWTKLEPAGHPLLSAPGGRESRRPDRGSR